MTQYLLVNRIRVQNANAVSGFTWGFPAITHFLGFTHSLSLRLAKSNFNSISLAACAVIAHEHHVHTCGKYGDSFTQSRNPPYLPTHDKASAPPVIEEGKMNMTVSLLMEVDGRTGNASWVEGLIHWVTKNCLMQRLAGGTILDIADVQLVNTEQKQNRYAIKRKLLPGFVLMDRSSSLVKHHQSLLQENPNAELLDAWLDFSAYKQQARPKSDRITKYLEEGFKQDEGTCAKLLQDWREHLALVPYQQDSIPNSLKTHFASLEGDKKLLAQWQAYLAPDEKTAADWERLPKPEATGYLVPIMVGYKAITPVYQNEEIANTRDSETPVCFVEGVHSVGEWKSAHRLRTETDFAASIWRYDYQEHWYLCRQDIASDSANDEDADTAEEQAVVSSDYDFGN